MNIRQVLSSIFRFNQQKANRNQVFPLAQFLRQATDPNRRITLADIKQRAEIPKLDATLEEFEQTYGVAVWVYACLNVIAEKSASVRWRWRNMQDNEVLDATLVEMLQPKPNNMMSWNLLRQTKAIHQGTTGNAYWWIKRENTHEGFDVEYFPLRPSRVKVVPSKDGMSILGYAYRLKDSKGGKITGPDGTEIIMNNWTMSGIPTADDNVRKIFTQAQFEKLQNEVNNGEMKQAKIKPDEWMPIPVEDMIHFRDPHSFNDFYGMPPLQPLVLSLMTDLYGRQWNKKFFENSAIPPIVISLPEGISEEDFDEIVERWNEKHKDVKKAWTAHFQEGAVSVHVIDINHSDMDFLNQLRASREDVLAALNVPPLMVGIYEFSSTTGRSAGAEQQRENFWKDNIIPKQTMDDDFINDKIDFGENIRLEHDHEGIDALRPDDKDLAAAGKDALVGGLTVEETRERIWNVSPEWEGTMILPVSASRTTSPDGTVTENFQYQQVQGKKKDPIIDY